MFRRLLFLSEESLKDICIDYFDCRYQGTNSSSKETLTGLKGVATMNVDSFGPNSLYGNVYVNPFEITINGSTLFNLCQYGDANTKKCYHVIIISNFSNSGDYYRYELFESHGPFFYFGCSLYNTTNIENGTMDVQSGYRTGAGTSTIGSHVYIIPYSCLYSAFQQEFS